MERGFIGWLILIVVALALLKYYYDFSIIDAAASEQGQGTISYISNLFSIVWSYIATPVKFIWNEVAWPILNLAWQSLQSFIDFGKANINR
jgi:hypothetical protein